MHHDETPPAVLPIYESAQTLLAQVEALPASRQRSLAITALEQAFVHAVYAATGAEPLPRRPADPAKA